MKYRDLGRTGLVVSEIGFGAGAIGGSWGPQSEEDSVQALHRALDLGVTLIDTAAGYGNGHSERIVGKVMKERKAWGKVAVATKIQPAPGAWPPSPYDRVEERYPEKYLRESLEERLANLGTDCVDVLQLHTWSRAWNRDPSALEVLQDLRDEGKLRFLGISTPEHDQNALVQLIRDGWLDVVQVIFNLFEQEPAAELLPAAAEAGVGVIARMPFDEGALTGKYTEATTFEESDFRSRYFMGDRLKRVVREVGKVREDLEGTGFPLPEAALKFVLAHPAVSTTIPGMRNPGQSQANCSVSDRPDLPEALLARLRRHNWRRAFWYEGR
jgi:aryl-alcohol dehydrogenase-like predicted oxidoreductase